MLNTSFFQSQNAGYARTLCTCSLGHDICVFTFIIGFELGLLVLDDEADDEADDVTFDEVIVKEFFGGGRSPKSPLLIAEGALTIGLDGFSSSSSMLEKCNINQVQIFSLRGNKVFK